jgi:uncharacterized protein (DUF2141 family)
MKLSKSRTARVKGHVSQALVTGRPSIAVGLMPRRSEAMFMYRSRVVDAKGNFELTGVTPGAYYIRATMSANGKMYTGLLPVDVGARNVEGLNVTIGAGATITGRLRFDGNQPGTLPNMQLRLTPRDMSMMMSPNMAKYGDDGAFRIEDVAPDLYNVTVFGMPDGYYIKSVRSGEQELLVTGVDATAAVAPLEVVVGTNAGQLTGAAQNPANQQPAAGATVVLVPQEQDRRAVFSFYKTTSTDQHGNFSFKNLTPGEYKVFAWEDIEPGAYADPNFIKPVESKGEAVTIKEGVAPPVQVTIIPVEEPVQRQR